VPTFKDLHDVIIHTWITKRPAEVSEEKNRVSVIRLSITTWKNELEVFGRSSYAWLLEWVLEDYHLLNDLRDGHTFVSLPVLHVLLVKDDYII